MTNLDSILKSRDITLATKVCLVKAMVFPVVMFGCESWTVKKLSTKELMLLNCGVGEDLRVPWTARKSNQSILKVEKEMATHSSVLAWRIPGTEEPSGLPSMGLHRVGHD